MVSLLMALALIIFVVGGGFYLYQKQPLPNTASPYPAGTSQDDTIYLTSLAQSMYARAKQEGKDLSNGPCLGTIPGFSDWVVDIAHSPRLPVDDDPTNQCEAFRNGQAKHFIELDPNGNVIKMY